MTHPWWQHESHVILEDDILCDGHSLIQLARTHGTPLYVYSKTRIQQQLKTMQAALDDIGVPHVIYYAMKSSLR
jgi:diaminopimelate decarboxylase